MGRGAAMGSTAGAAASTTISILASVLADADLARRALPPSAGALADLLLHPSESTLIINTAANNRLIAYLLHRKDATGSIAGQPVDLPNSNH
jgi:hypothetical protein